MLQLDVSDEALQEPGIKFSAWKFGGKKKSLLAGSERFLGESLEEVIKVDTIQIGYKFPFRFHGRIRSYFPPRNGNFHSLYIFSTLMTSLGEGERLA